MSGSEGYIKNLLGPKGCKNVSWITLSFNCNTHASHHILLYSWVTNLPLDTLHFASVLYVWCWTHLILKTLLSELGFFEVGMTQCIFWLPGSVWAFLILSLSIIISLLWSSSSTIPKGDWGNFYNGPLLKLSWCHDLLLIRVLQTCLSC
jgi:hypothetical protein